MALSVSCTCCALVRASAACCGYLCYPTAVMRLWPLWSNPVPLSLIWCTCVLPLFLRCFVIRHMVLIALKREKVLRLPPRSYRLYNWLSHFRFDTPTQSVSWSPVVLCQMRVSSPHLFPVRPNQLTFWTSRLLFVPTVLWTSPQGYPPLGCDRSWLVGLRLVREYNGNEYPYAWSTFVVLDL